MWPVYNLRKLTIERRTLREDGMSCVTLPRTFRFGTNSAGSASSAISYSPQPHRKYCRKANTWVGLSMALLCVVLISLPWKKLFNVLAPVGMMAWLVVTRAIPGFTFLQHNPIWLLIGLACVIVSCWDPDPEDIETEVELDPDLARSLQAMG